jgi:hypothetical protein
MSRRQVLVSRRRSEAICSLLKRAMAYFAAGDPDGLQQADCCSAMRSG